jgi:hypothetical protein
MISSDPWIALATDRSGSAVGPWCTTLPPPPPVLATGVTFQCSRWTAVNTSEWIALVRTQWPTSVLDMRLADAWIPCLFAGGVFVGTCVLRPPTEERAWWILETLCAQKGYGTPLMRSAMTWIYKHNNGPFALAYTWELTGAQLIAAWWRGWLQSMIALEYGWTWSGCGWCPQTTNTTNTTESQFSMPTVFRFDHGIAVVSDSGLRDGWGYVTAVRGTPDWSAIATRGGWQRLWMRSAMAPSADWRWTGEFVVVGLLNLVETPQNVEWVTAEIAYSLSK